MSLPECFALGTKSTFYGWLARQAQKKRNERRRGKCSVYKFIALVEFLVGSFSKCVVRAVVARGVVRLGACRRREGDSNQKICRESCLGISGCMKGGRCVRIQVTTPARRKRRRWEPCPGPHCSEHVEFETVTTDWVNFQEAERRSSSTTGPDLKLVQSTPLEKAPGRSRQLSSIVLLQLHTHTRTPAQLLLRRLNSRCFPPSCPVCKRKLRTAPCACCSRRLDRE